MTPLSIALNLALSFAGLAALCLSMDRHHRAIAGRGQSRTRARGLRLAGWAVIAVSFAAAILTSDWNFGPVQWIGSLTGAALLVVALVSYRPAWIRPAALLALPLALAAVLLA
ncbi:MULTISPECIES: DUF3325 domain-containing protein [unclassified Methylobacterium]|uniref:DUF3325 domain-containing protein n=1 Tax=unclassified Methylobacterium TaxID=2615210 RepID=UPI0006F4F05D|nr:MULTISPECIES: DUF3325 domain-containing protein [unclassified Methylobacterium]KQP88141.1 iron transporter [Methylobacterium sp. Leaf117]KQP94761.1 iron transporter [Methylobacterium sp. Leaf113]MCK2055941.1 DUF3325 domain-containing protein [Methylobacterium sp. 37f]